MVQLLNKNWLCCTVVQQRQQMKFQRPLKTNDDNFIITISKFCQQKNVCLEIETT